MIDTKTQSRSNSNSSQESKNKLFFLFLLITYSILFLVDSSNETKFLIVIFTIIALIVFYFNDNLVKFIHSDSLNPIPKSFVSKYQNLDDLSVVKRCKKCGTANTKSAEFCSVCGSSLDE